MAANKEMLVIGRESRRMTQMELAADIGVSQGTISKVEAGAMQASEEVVGGYSRRLRYPREFFEESPPLTRLPVTFYRKKRKTEMPRIRAVEAQMRILRMHLWKLLRSVEAPKLTVPLVDLGKQRCSAAELAHEIRLRWNVPGGPIANLTTLLELHGCFIIKWDFDAEDIEAVSMHEDGLPPLIAVNRGASGDRLRYTLAHELGHIAMHHHLVLPGGDCEEEADAFAAEFLMPHRDIRPFLSGLSLERLAQLKAHWGTSMQALLCRAGELETISETQRGKLWRTMNTMGMLKKEPVDIRAEEPSLVKRLVAFHMKRLGFTVDEMCRNVIPWDQEEFTRTYLEPSASRGGLRILK